MDASVQEWLERVLQLEVMEEPGDDWYAEVSRSLCPASAFKDPQFKGLFKEQALALSAYIQHGKLFALIGAGGGKTDVAWGCAHYAMSQYGHRRVLLLTTNGVYDQVVGYGLNEAKAHLGVDVPVVRLGHMSKNQRKAAVMDKSPGVFAAPYSLLSTRDAWEMLEEIGATCVIADEAHRLKNLSAAGPKRLFRNLRKTYESGKDVQVLLMSGTMSTKGLYDYHQLASVAMGVDSPAPLTENTARDAGAFVDADAMPTGPMREMSPLLKWSHRFGGQTPKFDVASCRAAYQHRLRTMPGVVVSVGNLAPSELRIHRAPTRAMNEECARFLDGVQELMITPSGDEIEYGLHRFRWEQTLAAGFYTELYWDEDKWEPEALARAKEQLDALNQYRKGLRRWLESGHVPGLDTPMLVGKDMFLYGAKNVPGMLYQSWQNARSLEFEGMPEREHRTVLVSDHRIEDVVEWSRHRQHGLIWCHHNAMREWLVAALKEEHGPSRVVNVPAGEAHLLRDLNRTKFYVLSLTGYQEGVNLQLLNESCYPEWPRSAKTAEQSMARTHRNGQKADEVHATLFRSCEVDDATLAATLTDSLYMQATVGTRQRLMVATYTFKPAIFDQHELATRVGDLQTLSSDLQQSLRARFA